MRFLSLIFLIAFSALPAQAARYIHGTGDSILYGYLASNRATKNPLALIATKFPVSFFQNDAQVAVWPTLASQTSATDTIAAFTAAKVTGYTSYTEVVHLGGDDFIDGTSVAAVQGYWSTWITNLRTAHPDVKIVGCTILYANVGGTVNGKRASLNTWMRTFTVANGHADGFDYIADIDANPIFGTDYTNHTYYQSSDELHLTDVGYAAWSAILRAVLVTNYLIDPNYYVTQSGTGSGTGATLANSASVASHNSHTATAGDLISLNGTLTSTLVVTNSGSAGNPITYVFAAGAKFSKGAWGVDSSSAMYGSGKSFICVDGVNVGMIENTDNGDALGTKQPSTGIFLTGCDDVEIKNLTIQNMFVHTYGVDNPATADGYSTQAVKISNGNRVNVHDCIMRHMYMAVYIYTETAITVTGNEVHDCTISNCSTGLIASNGSTGSQINNTAFYRNDIELGLNWYDTPNHNHIDGIHTWTGAGSSMSNLLIYSNYIHGDSSAHCTGYIFVTDNVPSCYIFNNLIDGDIAGTNHASEGWINFNLLAGSHVYVLNNTINGNGTGSEGGNGISHDPGATGSTITAKNNIITNCNIGFFDGAAWTTYDFSRNCYYGNGSAGRSGATYYTTLANWVAFNGETNSVSGNPGFDSSFKFTSASPCYLSGADLSAVVPGGLLAFYRDGTARPAGAMNMGSEPLQGGGGSPPTAPSGLTPSGVSSSQINLTWTDNSSTETGFIVEKSLDNSNWTAVTTTSANVTSLNGVTGLTASTLYYLRVRATNGYGSSSNATTSATTSAAVTSTPKGRAGSRYSRGTSGRH